MSTQIEHLQQLLDGELDPMHESTLYGELSVNGAPRTEFREQIALKNAVQDDRMTLMPPAALTNSLFTGMGFAAPLAGAAVGAAGGSMLLQWLSRLGIPLLSAITAATLTWTISEQPNSRIQEQPNVIPSTARNEQPNVIPSTARNESTNDRENELAQLRDENVLLRERLASANKRGVNVIPSETRNATVIPSETRNANVIPSETRNATVIPSAARNEQPNVIPSEARNEQTNNVEADVNPLTQQVRVANDITMTRNADTRFIAPQTLTSASMMMRTYPSLMVQVRGFQLAPTVSTAANEETDWYSNLGFAALYQLNARHSVGLEVGNESYPMVFEGDRNGQLVRYEQYPTTAWAGLTYRYTGVNLGSTSFAPYGQFMIGGSKFGPVGRMSGGMQYSPVGPLSFLFGIETSALAYSFQDAWYLSPKIGLTYGLAVRF
ncbi:MAG: hypothetical protein EHM43_01840 [Ignavibacteriae bacterium]|nr:MAG: hypothetical protein EHM43_01840 [Ignavibacteriota bacterium]